MNEPRIIRPNAGFIIPTRRFVDIEIPKGRTTMSGRYMLIKRNAWGTEVERTPWFDNIILDSGLNRMGTGAAITGAAIGTGTSTPTASQTGLDTESHYTTTTGTGNAAISALGSSPYNNTYTVVYRTTLGDLDGNYSEVGVGWISGSMFSRALILDGGGSPTTISVSSVQQLDILYQLSVYPPIVDTGPTTITISGSSYDVTGRAASVNSTSSTVGWGPQVWTTRAVTVNGTASVYSGALGAITSSPSGTFAGVGSVSLVGSYSNNSLQREASAVYQLTNGNVSGGVMSAGISWGSPSSISMAAFQYQFDPVLPKDGTKTMSLNYVLTWARRP